LGVPDPEEEVRIQRVTRSLQQQLVIEGRTIETTTLEERMDQLGVPAVSVAVIDDGELSWAGAWGVVEAGGEQKVTTDTIFQAGSVSKPVAALLALALVGEGKLALGQPVNDVLKSWKVPDNEFTREQPVTLFHVLTHQAGFTPFAYGIPRSEAPLGRTAPGRDPRLARCDRRVRTRFSTRLLERRVLRAAAHSRGCLRSLLARTGSTRDVRAARDDPEHLR
jgi:CubicO group peptidase (beta-lactamase class C family)